MTKLATLARSVQDYAAANAITVIPAAPERGYGPEVNISPDAMDLPSFLELAAKLGGGVLYLDATAFEPDTEKDTLEDPPVHLTKHKGEIGNLAVAFVINGLPHFWEQSTPWHMEWRQLLDAQPSSLLGRPRAADDTDMLTETVQVVGRGSRAGMTRLPC